MPTTAIIGFDIKDYSLIKANDNKILARQILSTTFKRLGLRINKQIIIRIDTGDGFIITLDDNDIPSIIEKMITYNEILKNHMTKYYVKEGHIKVRGVLHFGTWDFCDQIGDDGWETSQDNAVGEDIDFTARLLDSEPLKKLLFINEDNFSFVFGISESCFNMCANMINFQLQKINFNRYQFVVKKTKGDILLYLSDKANKPENVHTTEIANNASVNELTKNKARNLERVIEITRIHVANSGDFIGRKNEILKIQSAIETGRIDNVETNLIAIDAIGGVGKTRLLIESLRNSDTNRFKKIIWYSFYFKDPAIDTFIGLLGKEIDPLHDNTNINDTIKMLIDYFKKTRVLLVIDGLELIQCYQPETIDHGLFFEYNEINPIVLLLNSILDRSESLILTTSRIPFNNKDIDISQNCIKRISLNQFDEDEGYALFLSKGGDSTREDFHLFYEKYGGHALMIIALAGILKRNNKGLNHQMVIEELINDIDNIEEYNKEAFKLYRIYKHYFIQNQENTFQDKIRYSILVFIALQTLELSYKNIRDLCEYINEYYQLNISDYKIILRKFMYPLKRAGFIELIYVSGTIDRISMHPLIKDIIPVFGLKDNNETLTIVARYLNDKASSIPEISKNDNRIVFHFLDKIGYMLIIKEIELAWQTFSNNITKLRELGFSRYVFNYLEKFYSIIKTNPPGTYFNIEENILFEYFMMIKHYCYENKIAEFEKTLEYFDIKRYSNLWINYISNMFVCGNLIRARTEALKFEQIYPFDFEYNLVQKKRFNFIDEIYSTMEPTIDKVREWNRSNENDLIILIRLNIQFGLFSVASEMIKLRNDPISLQLKQYLLVKQGNIDGAKKVAQDYKDLLNEQNEFQFFKHEENYLTLITTKEAGQITDRYLASGLIHLYLWEAIPYIWSQIYKIESMNNSKERTDLFKEILKNIDETYRIMNKHSCFFDIIELNHAKEHFSNLTNI